MPARYIKTKKADIQQSLSFHFLIQNEYCCKAFKGMCFNIFLFQNDVRIGIIEQTVCVCLIQYPAHLKYNT